MIEELEDLEEDPKRTTTNLMIQAESSKDRPIKGMNKSRSKSTHCDLLWNRTAKFKPKHSFPYISI